MKENIVEHLKLDEELDQSKKAPLLVSEMISIMKDMVVAMQALAELGELVKEIKIDIEIIKKNTFASPNSYPLSPETVNRWSLPFPPYSTTYDSSTWSTGTGIGTSTGNTDFQAANSTFTNLLNGETLAANDSTTEVAGDEPAVDDTTAALDSMEEIADNLNYRIDALEEALDPNS